MGNTVYSNEIVIVLLLYTRYLRERREFSGKSIFAIFLLPFNRLRYPTAFFEFRVLGNLLFLIYGSTLVIFI